MWKGTRNGITFEMQVSKITSKKIKKKRKKKQRETFFKSFWHVLNTFLKKDKDVYVTLTEFVLDV